MFPFWRQNRCSRKIDSDAIIDEFDGASSVEESKLQWDEMAASFKSCLLNVKKASGIPDALLSKGAVLQLFNNFLFDSVNSEVHSSDNLKSGCFIGNIKSALK